MTKPSFFDLTISDLADELVAAGHKKFAATQLFEWVYDRKILDIESWTNVSKKCREWLSETYSFDLPKVIFLSNVDYNIGLDTCNDARSFRELFRRYGNVIENPDQSRKKSNIFNKFFN